MAKEIKIKSKSPAWATKLRKYSRDLHGHLSFFYAGMVFIYAISGFTMNHLNSFDPQYEISVRHYKAGGTFPHTGNYSQAQILELLQPVSEQDNFKKAFYPNPNTLKVFLAGGSTFTLDKQSGQVDYEGIKKRPFFFQLSFLHYNPGIWWRYFSDSFAVSFVIICITGLVMNKGKRGMMGIRGIEFIVGVLIPLLFLLLV